MYNHQTAISLIESRIPHLSDELHNEIREGLLHVQIGAFSAYAQAVVDSGNEIAWATVISTFMELWQHCDADVENALNVSFLELLRFDGSKRAWAYDAMPTAMQKAWKEMDDYLRKIHGG